MKLIVLIIGLAISTDAATNYGVGPMNDAANIYGGSGFSSEFSDFDEFFPRPDRPKPQKGPDGNFGPVTFPQSPSKAPSKGGPGGGSQGPPKSNSMDKKGQNDMGGKQKKNSPRIPVLAALTNGIQNEIDKVGDFIPFPLSIFLGMRGLDLASVCYSLKGMDIAKYFNYAQYGNMPKMSSEEYMNVSVEAVKELIKGLTEILFKFEQDVGLDLASTGLFRFADDLISRLLQVWLSDESDLGFEDIFDGSLLQGVFDIKGNRQGSSQGSQKGKPGKGPGKVPIVPGKELGKPGKKPLKPGKEPLKPGKGPGTPGRESSQPGKGYGKPVKGYGIPGKGSQTPSSPGKGSLGKPPAFSGKPPSSVPRAGDLGSNNAGPLSTGSVVTGSWSSSGVEGPQITVLNDKKYRTQYGKGSGYSVGSPNKIGPGYGTPGGDGGGYGTLDAKALNYGSPVDQKFTTSGKNSGYITAEGKDPGYVWSKVPVGWLSKYGNPDSYGAPNPEQADYIKRATSPGSALGVVGAGNGANAGYSGNDFSTTTTSSTTSAAIVDADGNGSGYFYTSTGLLPTSPINDAGKSIANTGNAGQQSTASAGKASASSAGKDSYSDDGQYAPDSSTAAVSSAASSSTGQYTGGKKSAPDTTSPASSAAGSGGSYVGDELSASSDSGSTASTTGSGGRYTDVDLSAYSNSDSTVTTAGSGDSPSGRQPVFSTADASAAAIANKSGYSSGQESPLGASEADASTAGKSVNGDGQGYNIIWTKGSNVNDSKYGSPGGEVPEYGSTNQEESGYTWSKIPKKWLSKYGAPGEYRQFGQGYGAPDAIKLQFTSTEQPADAKPDADASNVATSFSGGYTGNNIAGFDGRYPGNRASADSASGSAATDAGIGDIYSSGGLSSSAISNAAASAGSNGIYTGQPSTLDAGASAASTAVSEGSYADGGQSTNAITDAAASIGATANEGSQQFNFGARGDRSSPGGTGYSYGGQYGSTGSGAVGSAASAINEGGQQFTFGTTGDRASPGGTGYSYGGQYGSAGSGAVGSAASAINEGGQQYTFGTRGGGASSAGSGNSYLDGGQYGLAGNGAAASGSTVDAGNQQYTFTGRGASASSASGQYGFADSGTAASTGTAGNAGRYLGGQQYSFPTSSAAGTGDWGSYPSGGATYQAVNGGSGRYNLRRGMSAGGLGYMPQYQRSSMSSNGGISNYPGYSGTNSGQTLANSDSQATSQLYRFQ